MLAHASTKCALALTAAATAAAIGLAPAAHADAYTFLDDLGILRFDVSNPGNMVSTGYIACDGLNLNRAVAEVYRWVHSSRASESVTEVDTARFLTAAVLDLCPRHLDRLAAAVGA